MLMIKGGEVDYSMALKHLQENGRIYDERLFFVKLPKGVPIPPSAPSKRLRISYREKKAFEQCHREPIISCLVQDCSEAYPEPLLSSVSKNGQEEASINLNLPRRSLLVTFSCNACGARSQRLINRLAYERGLVYVQCSGCSQYHKLVDNLGLVVEHNLQEEVTAS
ncbi:uncharacterized protein [Primulina eburnea]|uniref:uncharacterized protein n=1 Tax=Primulina eburnea TaxID=1245227 RepID=UPI003C6C93A2